MPQWIGSSDGRNATLNFVLERETKGAVRYAEVQDSSLDEATIGTLYIRKSAIREAGLTVIPKSVRISLYLVQD